ncbi:MAG: glycosyl hydrolase 53 family protein [Ignavibacteriaceae bacterium]
MKKFNLLIQLLNIPFSFLLLLLVLQPQEVKAQFANGADVGWLSQMEAYGYVFKDNSGVQKNCLEVLKEKGINALRFRVWVNPSGGYCNVKDVAHMAYIADSMGFQILIDFHLSDTWADPGHQTKPAAWVNDSFAQLQTDVYNHVYGVLDTLRSIGVIPKWVQIGNEVGNGILWPDGKAPANMSNFAKLINSGYNAAKAVDSTIQVIIHLEDGHNDALFRQIFAGLKSNGAKWDIIGMSVYPYWANLSWQADDSLALITMKDMISLYNTKIMVCEAGYLYNQPVQANQYLLDLIAKTKSIGGLGVFYWEPESYNWPINQVYQLGAWDPKTKEPTAALDAFLGINVTSVTKEKSIPLNYDLKIYPNPFNPSTTIEYTLPKSSNTSIVIYDILGEQLVTLVDGLKQAGSYDLTWSAQNVPSGVYICVIRSGNFFETKKIVLLK